MGRCQCCCRSLEGLKHPVTMVLYIYISIQHVQYILMINTHGLSFCCGLYIYLHIHIHFHIYTHIYIYIYIYRNRFTVICHQSSGLAFPCPPLENYERGYGYGYTCATYEEGCTCNEEWEVECDSYGYKACLIAEHVIHFPIFWFHCAKCSHNVIP